MGWMELKDPSKAQVLLSRSFTNVTEPFKVSLTSTHHPWPLSSPSVVVSTGQGSYPTLGWEPWVIATLCCLQVWTENADGSGAVNFLTGMGGFLQAALFGCTGFR